MELFHGVAPAALLWILLALLFMPFKAVKISNREKKKEKREVK